MSKDFLSMFVDLYGQFYYQVFGKYTLCTTDKIIDDKMHSGDFNSEHFVIDPALLIHS